MFVGECVRSTKSRKLNVTLMFTSIRSCLAVAALLLLILSSCKKNEVDPTKGFSDKIQSIISSDDIAKLRARGMVINEGSVPPTIEGIYVSSPHELLSGYDGDTYKNGYTFSDLIFRFTDQNSTDKTAKVDIKNGGATGTGVGGFLAGNGSSFTFFAEIDLKSGTATAKQVRIFSGEITPDGIKNFYTTLLVTSKVDPNDELIPVGASRIIKDSNGLASSRTTFRAGAIDSTRSDESVR